MKNVNYEYKMFYENLLQTLNPSWFKFLLKQLDGFYKTWYKFYIIWDHFNIIFNLLWAVIMAYQ
jgi:hypothetical protein